MNNTNKLQVAETILEQLGGAARLKAMIAARLKAMIGARDFVGDTDSLTFKIGQSPK